MIPFDDDRALIAGLLLALGSGLAGPAPAQPVSPGVVAPVARDGRMVEHKLRLVDRMLHDSPVATRLASSTHAEAKRHFQAAHDLHDAARTLSDAGRLSEAEPLLDEAMRRIASARELEPTPARQRTEDRTRFEQLLKSIEALDAAYARNVQRLSPDLARAGDEDLGRARVLVERARAMWATEQFAEGSALLERAQRDLLANHQKLLGTAPIVYGRQFDSPADEYDFELERNRDYERLVPLAVAELRPPRDARTRIDQFAQRGRQLTVRAAQLAERGDHVAAVRTLNDSTDQLQRALAAAGLVVPQSMPR